MSFMDKIDGILMKEITEGVIKMISTSNIAFNFNEMPSSIEEELLGMSATSC